MLVDTDILIDLQRGHPPAVQWVSASMVLPQVPGFVVMELIRGCRNKKSLLAVEKLIDPFDIVWAETEECELALGFFSRLYLSHNLGMIDSLIAGMAVGRDTGLCSFNEKHFGAVPGLKRLAPYTRS